MRQTPAGEILFLLSLPHKAVDPMLQQQPWPRGTWDNTVTKIQYYGAISVFCMFLTCLAWIVNVTADTVFNVSAQHMQLQACVQYQLSMLDAAGKTLVLTRNQPQWASSLSLLKLYYYWKCRLFKLAPHTGELHYNRNKEEFC